MLWEHSSGSSRSNGFLACAQKVVRSRTQTHIHLSTHTFVSPRTPQARNTADHVETFSNIHAPHLAVKHIKASVLEQEQGGSQMAKVQGFCQRTPVRRQQLSRSGSLTVSKLLRLDIRACTHVLDYRTVRGMHTLLDWTTSLACVPPFTQQCFCLSNAHFLNGMQPLQAVSTSPAALCILHVCARSCCQQPCDDGKVVQVYSTVKRSITSVWAQPACVLVGSEKSVKPV